MPPVVTRVRVNVMLVTADSAIDRTVTVDLSVSEDPLEMAAKLARRAANLVLDRLDGKDNRSPKEAA
jgi:hypothetical protein